MKFEHIPVLLDEAVDLLNIKAGGVYIDGTVGGAGHSAKIAERLGAGLLIALDKDPQAIQAAKERLSKYGNVKVIQSDFSEMPSVLEEFGIKRVDGILLDLGVSSHQLDMAERGFSYNHESPLDMRMSMEGGSADMVINEWPAEELERIFRIYGEEKFARRIASNIVKNRALKPIRTTLELAEIIKQAIPAAVRREGGHPAKRSFQAIRIAVNGELDSLTKALGSGFEYLSEGGRFAVISFHSLEDRLVKNKFEEYASGCVCPPDFPICVCGRKPRARQVIRKPILPSETEISMNRRSKSAKLRVLERII